MKKRRSGLSFHEPEKKKHFPVLPEVFVCLVLMLIAAFIATVSVYFFGMRCRVVGTSMEPGLKNGQEVLVNKFAYTLMAPKIGDVVVFLPRGNEHSHYYVKRIVAGPGDKVQVKDGLLYVNGAPSEWITQTISDSGTIAEEITLQNGQFFCMGDNPEDGEDSRQANIGPVDKKDIVGQAWWHREFGEEKMGLVH